MEKWPHFFIVGAEKAGTTSLYNYLKKIPDVFMCPVKEPYYFSTSITTNTHWIFPIHDQSKYLKLFKNAKDRELIGESSPLYLWDPTSSKLIHEKIPNARIIISLRNPIERAYSHYLQNYHGIEKESFHNAIHRKKSMKNYSLTQSYLEEGLYTNQILRYLDLFGSKQIKILIFEEWTKNIKGTISELLEFLGVDQTVPENVGNIHNPYSVPRLKFFKTIAGIHGLRIIAGKILPPSALNILENLLFSEDKKRPQMLPEDRVFLEKYFIDDVKKLENLLGRQLPWFTQVYENMKR